MACQAWSCIGRGVAKADTIYAAGHSCFRNQFGVDFVLLIIEILVKEIRQHVESLLVMVFILIETC